jgi:hypothetical protein
MTPMPDSIGIAHPPEIEGVSISTSERMLLLILDHLEGVDGLFLATQYLSHEDAPRIVTVTEDPTVEPECVGHVALRASVAIRGSVSVLDFI